jgi:hypothetical protein
MTCEALLERPRAQWSAKPQTQQGRPCRLKCFADRRCACRLPFKKILPWPDYRDRPLKVSSGGQLFEKEDNQG